MFRTDEMTSFFGIVYIYLSSGTLSLRTVVKTSQVVVCRSVETI